MNSDANARTFNVKSLAEKEVNELKALAIMYHSRGLEKEAAAIFHLIDKLRKPSDSASA